MKPFFARLSLFLAILAALAWAADYGLGLAYRSMVSGRDAKTTYVLTRAREDVLVVGTSRAIHHYVPEVISKATGLSVFNAGRDGMSLFYCEGVIRAALARYKPRLILLDLYEEDLQAHASDAGRLSVFAPYLGSDPSLAGPAREAGRWAALGFRLPVYRYNAKLIPIVLNNLARRGEGGQGYIPLRDRMEAVPLPDAAADPEPDPAKLRSLERTLAACAAAGVPLVAVRSPVYQRPGPHPNVRRMEGMFARYGMRYLDLASPEGLLKPEYFKDATHLNHDGAGIFSEALARELGPVVRPVAAQ